MNNKTESWKFKEVSEIVKLSNHWRIITFKNQDKQQHLKLKNFRSKMEVLESDGFCLIFLPLLFDLCPMDKLYEGYRWGSESLALSV